MKSSSAGPAVNSHRRKQPQVKNLFHHGRLGSSSKRLFSFVGMPGVGLACCLIFICSGWEYPGPTLYVGPWPLMFDSMGPE